MLTVGKSFTLTLSVNKANLSSTAGQRLIFLGSTQAWGTYDLVISHSQNLTSNAAEVLKLK